MKDFKCAEPRTYAKPNKKNVLIIVTSNTCIFYCHIDVFYTDVDQLMIILILILFYKWTICGYYTFSL